MSSQTSPSLTMSSGSASSTSGPPTTPLPRQRRYPSLGRVPLHRRGTSSQYERLEDLLREAGYKETRIFTPESDRVEKTAKGDNATESARSGVGAVVGFLAGLMQKSEGNQGVAKEDVSEGGPRSNIVAAPSYSPPASPLAQRRYPRPRSPESFASSSVDSLNLRRRVHRPMPDAASNSPIAHPTPQPSRATAYLRHMSSIPNIPRPKSTPPVLRQNTGHNAHHNAQPAPNSWLDYVSQALVKSSNPTNLTPTPTRPQLRPTRSSLSQVTTHSARTIRTRAGKSPLQEHHPVLPSLALITPSLLSTGEVTHSRVVCRSAPGSRAASRSRGPKDAAERGQAKSARENLMWNTEDGFPGRQQDANPTGSWGFSWGRRAHGRPPGRKKRRGRAPADNVPSLARTRVEGDVWSLHMHPVPLVDAETQSDVERPSASGRRHHHHKHGPQTDTDGASTSGSESDSEGELDLARILVPPKRQHSIRSLRRHLDRQPPPVPPLPAAFMNPQRQRGRQSASRDADEDDDSSTIQFGQGSDVPTWSLQGGGADGRRTWGRARGRALLGEREDDVEGEDETWGSGWVRRNGSRGGGGGDTSRSRGDGEGGDSHNHTAGRRQRLPGPWAAWGS
ncbi:hypothetical protein HGRIS_000561 [Hohenbuehelia grisea]|uniref:Uncharacterized protein n=1 Tax=Hohenbuehelia grisea TaxID=104357 RepID=A0ABR3JTF4_9AGAR